MSSAVIVWFAARHSNGSQKQQETFNLRWSDFNSENHQLALSPVTNAELSLHQGCPRFEKWSGTKRTLQTNKWELKLILLKLFMHTVCHLQSCCSISVLFFTIPVELLSSWLCRFIVRQFHASNSRFFNHAEVNTLIYSMAILNCKNITL